MRTKTTFLREPSGAAYEELLTFASSRFARFLLVVRDTLELADSAKNLLHRLEPFELGRERTNHWPGTELLDDKALVMEFLLSVEACEALKHSATGLFDWQQPARPEDLCLLQSDGRPWLVTIAHERDAYVVASKEEIDAMRWEAPRLRECLP